MYTALRGTQTMADVQKRRTAVRVALRHRERLEADRVHGRSESLHQHSCFGFHCSAGEAHLQGHNFPFNALRDVCAVILDPLREHWFQECEWWVARLAFRWEE